MDDAKAQSAKYLAINELEAKGSWIRYFKFVCAAWALICVGYGVTYAWLYLHALTHLYFLGSSVLGFAQAIVYGLQAKAIQNVEYDLQKNLVRFFYFNTIAAPAWVTVGPILEASLPAIISGIGTFVVCGILLIFSFQVKRVFENKKAFVLTADDCA